MSRFPKVHCQWLKSKVFVDAKCVIQLTLVIVRWIDGDTAKRHPRRKTLLPCNFNRAPPLNNKFMIAITY